jgi:hypothetical protein
MLDLKHLKCTIEPEGVWLHLATVGINVCSLADFDEFSARLVERLKAIKKELEQCQ